MKEQGQEMESNAVKPSLKIKPSEKGKVHKEDFIVRLEKTHELEDFIRDNLKNEINLKG